MAGYRLFYLNCNGHIRSFREVLASDDEEAERLSEKQRDGGMQLWILDRLVKSFSPADLDSQIVASEDHIRADP